MIKEIDAKLMPPEKEKEILDRIREKILAEEKKKDNGTAQKEATRKEQPIKEQPKKNQSKAKRPGTARGNLTEKIKNRS